MRSLWVSKRVIAVAADTEFTSFDKIGGDILATGFVEILEDFTLGREAEFFSRPTSSKYFTEGAQKIHGISYFKAQTFPTRRESCVRMLQWLKPLMDRFPLSFVYHGTGGLDYKWLLEHFRKEELNPSWTKAFPEALVESTLKMARENLKQLESHKLKEVARFYDIPLEDHHSALPDARACAMIYCKIKMGQSVFTGKLL
jgi:DNA polymerase III epsilon subunit-like protein